MGIKAKTKVVLWASDKRERLSFDNRRLATATASAVESLSKPIVM